MLKELNSCAWHVGEVTQYAGLQIADTRNQVGHAGNVGKECFLVVGAQIAQLYHVVCVLSNCISLIIAVTIAEETLYGNYILTGLQTSNRLCEREAVGLEVLPCIVSSTVAIIVCYG